MEDGFLEDKLNNVFKTSCLHLAENPKAKSQLLNAFNKIKTFGKSRAEFDKNLGLSVQEVPPGVEAPRKKPHPYKDLNATEQDDIFKAFSACAELPLEYCSNSSGRKGRRKGRKMRNRPLAGVIGSIVDVLEEHLKGMQHELSLLKKQEQEQSEKLQAASLSKIVDYNSAVALLLEAWTWEIHHASTPDKLLSV